MSAPEEWRPVVGWEGLYEVSSLGRARSLDREIPMLVHYPGRAPFWRVTKKPGRLLKPGINSNGYPGIRLCRDNIGEFRLIYELVCIAFHGPRQPGKEVAHNNGIRTDSRACNLRWATQLENQADKVAHGNSSFGERSHTAKLTDEAIPEILQKLRRMRIKDVAEQYGVSPQAIIAVRDGKAWKHIPRK